MITRMFNIIAPDVFKSSILFFVSIIIMMKFERNRMKLMRTVTIVNLNPIIIGMFCSPK